MLDAISKQAALQEEVPAPGPPADGQQAGRSASPIEKADESYSSNEKAGESFSPKRLSVIKMATSQVHRHESHIWDIIEVKGVDTMNKTDESLEPVVKSNTSSKTKTPNIGKERRNPVLPSSENIGFCDGLEPSERPEALAQEEQYSC